MGKTALGIAQVVLTPIGLFLQGLGVKTPVIFRFLPGYERAFLVLWGRHKNPISWVCRPFFGLIASYGAILHNWIILLIGLVGIGTSWFWFPKWRNTPSWAEAFINSELKTLTPRNPRDFKNVALPSIIVPLALVGLMVLLWFLPHPWNWLALIIYVMMTIAKVAWSARLESSVTRPLLWIILMGYVLGIIAGIPLILLLT